MSRAIKVFLSAILGYVLAAIAGYFLVDLLSSNTHDKALEAAMTSAFVFSPLGAIVAAVAGWTRSK